MKDKFTKDPNKIRPDHSIDKDRKYVFTFKDGTFTLVASTDTMEHIPSYQDVIKEAFRILKPGGRFIFTVPNKDYCDEHTWVYTTEGLRNLVQSFGNKGGVSIIKDDKQLDKWSLCWLDKQ